MTLTMRLSLTLDAWRKSHSVRFTRATWQNTHPSVNHELTWAIATYTPATNSSTTVGHLFTGGAA
jgi:hypothetical protein